MSFRQLRIADQAAARSAAAAATAAIAAVFVAGLVLVALAGPAAAVTRTEVFPTDGSACAGARHGLPGGNVPPAQVNAPVREPAVAPARDLVVLRWLGLEARPVTQDIPIEVRAGSVGLVVHALANSDSCLVSVELVGPGGELLACHGCPDAPAVGEADPGRGVTQMPSTDRPGWELVPGEYAFRVRALAYEDGPPCSGTTVDVTVQIRSDEGVHVERFLDLNFVYLPNSTLSADIAQSSELFARFLEAGGKWLERTGVRIGRVTHVDLDRPEFDVIATWEEAGRMFLTSAQVGRERALNVYCVQKFEAPLNPVVGLAGGIPGPAFNGSIDSGIALKMEPFFQCYECLRAYGSLFAHEVGHYLGFYHTSWADLSQWDPLSDTPECREANLRDCPDWNHVMFPVIHPANNLWSDSQVTIAHTSPIVRTVAIVGPTPTDHDPTPDPAIRLVHVGPSPFREETRIALSPTVAPGITADVYDVTGRRLRSLDGAREVVWDGRAANGSEVPAGIYFVRVSAGGRVETKRVVKAE